MVDIRHHVGITAAPERVCDAFATVEGLGGWWTRQVEGDAGPGGKLSFFFGQPEPSAVMEVTGSASPRRVEWRCISGPDEWLGTRVSFDIRPNGEETFVLFSHAGWREQSDFMAHCSTKWAYFLLGLKSGLEGGKATPYPEDMKISSWG
jgi:uncharacterized protein YndB with AHSA1/START domain